MRKILLLSAINLAVIRASQSMAACVPIPDCESLGYKYTQNICSNGSIICPFDNTKVFCFTPCFYTYTAEACAAQCKDIGTQTCMKDNVTYYKSCGESKCSDNETCNNGTCENSMKGQTFYCCDDGGYGCGGYYTRCKNYRPTYADCSDTVADYKSQGCSPVLQGCAYSDPSGTYYVTTFRCQ